MADLLIAPERYTTPGGVPRKLLAGVFVVVAALAMGTFLLTAPDEPLMTGDEKARAELKKPESVLAQSRGSAQWVDDAAAKALAARTEPVVPVPLEPAVDAMPLATRPAGAITPLPMLDPAASRAAVLAAGIDPAAVERDRSARAAAGTIYDEGHTGPTRPDGGGPADLPGAMMRRMGDLRGPEPSALAPVIEAIRATQGQVAAVTRAEAERQWAREMAAPQRDHVLRAMPAVTDLMLYQGTVIPAVLTRRINSDMPGTVTARVSMDVYDSRTSRRLLLPKGTLLSGAYNHDVKAGQSRLQFAFTRLKMPDGATFDLPGATGSDAAGQAGIEGDVDRHFFRSFGAALLLGVLADRVTRIAALPNGGPSGQGGISATGQVFVDTARAELERHRAIPPTVTIEEGSRVNVEVVRDMAFDTFKEAS